MNIIKDLLPILFEFLEDKDLYKLTLNRFLYSQIRECIYYRHIGNINNNNFLVKDNFEFIVENPIILSIMEIIGLNGCIAGGYTTSMFFFNTILEDSDIDIFVLDKNIYRVLRKLSKNFNIVSYLIKGNCVVDLKIEGINRNIQIISTLFESIGELLDSFDFSHCKTAYCDGSTYVTYDTILSKQKRITITYQNVSEKRLEKAKKYGLRILNHDFDLLDRYGPYERAMTFKTLEFENINNDNFLEVDFSYIGLRKYISSKNEMNIMSENIQFCLDENNIIRARKSETNFGTYYKRITEILPFFYVKGTYVYFENRPYIKVDKSEHEKIFKLKKFLLDLHIRFYQLDKLLNYSSVYQTYYEPKQIDESLVRRTRCSHLGFYYVDNIHAIFDEDDEEKTCIKDYFIRKVPVIPEYNGVTKRFKLSIIFDKKEGSYKNFEQYGNYGHIKYSFLD